MGAAFSRTCAIEVQLAGLKDSVWRKGTLYGVIPGRHFIAGGFWDSKYAEGDELVVKATMEGHVIGFWAKIEKHIEGENGLYLLAYPEQIDQLDLRMSQRLNVMIPAEMRLTGGKGGALKDLRFEGMLLNISDGGCLLSASGEWPAELPCELKFALPGEDHFFALAGQVVRLNKDGARTAKFGVQFCGGRSNAVALNEIQQWISDKKPYLTS